MCRIAVTTAMKAPRTGIIVTLKVFQAVFAYSSMYIMVEQAGDRQYHTHPINCHKHKTHKHKIHKKCMQQQCILEQSHPAIP